MQKVTSTPIPLCVFFLYSFKFEQKRHADTGHVIVFDFRSSHAFSSIFRAAEVHHDVVESDIARLGDGPWHGKHESIIWPVSRFVFPRQHGVTSYLLRLSVQNSNPSCSSGTYTPTKIDVCAINATVVGSNYPQRSP